MSGCHESDCSQDDLRNTKKKKILLMGNPNVGKSALFSRLTGVNVVCSNYPGTTVGFCQGNLEHNGKSYVVIDVPGTYSLDSTSPAEQVAVDMMAEGDLIINVVDSTNLERNLYLTLEILAMGIPTVIALNMSDDAVHRGIEIDDEMLEQIIGVSVIPTVAVTGKGIGELLNHLEDARSPGKKMSKDDMWRQAGYTVGRVQTLKQKEHSLLERIEDATIKPWTGIPLAILILFLTFQAIITSGNFLIENLLDPFFYGVYGPFIKGLVSSIVGPGLVSDLLIGRGDNFIESFGVLTTGVYVPLDMVLPFVILFYFSLSFLEDVGYLPRLATLMDNLMHRIGLHGQAIVPAILGLGCNVPGMLSTRILETKRQRFISATLMAICIPCLAQNSLIVGLLSRYGIQYIAIVYGTLLTVYIVTGLALNRILSGDSPELLREIPPYRMPNMSMLMKKTFTRVKYFLTDAVPYVLLGVFLINLAYAFGIIDLVSKTVGPTMSQLFGLPEEAVVALVVGFLRKDVAVGMLAPLGMSPEQLTIASTLLALFFPCVATFTVMYRELGPKDMAYSMSLMLLITVVVGFVLRLLLL